MNGRFALSLPLADAALLGPLRRWPAVEVCRVDNSIWLRAASLQDEQWEYCRRLPGADRYEVLKDGQLRPAGKLVPRGILPSGPWEPLAAWLRVELPRADTSLAAAPQMALKLVRSSEPRATSWLLTDMDGWRRYVDTAPQTRLARWTFAADALGAVIIRGTPLPPLRGTQYVEANGIGVPAGWTWSPAVDAAVVRAALRLEEGACALWQADGAWQRIVADDWVQATRSAVRLTAEEQHHGS
jgi:hypothetical protein